MAYCQGDVPGCASDPDVPGTSLDEGVPALASMENAHCCGIIREEVDKLPPEYLMPVDDRWTSFGGGRGGGTI